MKYVIIVERALHGPLVVGPFDALDEAKKYATTHFGLPSGIWGALDVWRTAKLEAPKEG